MIRVLITTLLILNLNLAYAFDEFEYGRLQSVVVRTGILADTFDIQCNADVKNKRWHMSEYLFKWKWKISVDSFMDDVGKKAMGMTGPAVKEMILKEAKTEIQNRGGCNSKKSKAWAKEMGEYFTEAYEILAKTEPPH